jgi:hypothetical protein
LLSAIESLLSAVGADDIDRKRLATQGVANITSALFRRDLCHRNGGANRYKRASGCA